MKSLAYPLILLSLITGCSSRKEKLTEQKLPVDTVVKVIEKRPNTPATILSKKEVPILCYHHIRNLRVSESATMKNYSVPPEAFAEQMKTLSDSGYQTISPDQLYEYLVYDGKLPPKPIMLTFDDTDEEQYSIGAAEMSKYNFKGVYFVMTVSINRPRYMSNDQLKTLSESGHIIAAHTWDHHMVTKYAAADFDEQLVKPKQKLEALVNKPVEYFAYPFGLWNPTAISEIKSRDYKLAFILSSKRDAAEPLYTIRRMLVPGTWTTPGLMKAMSTTFNKPAI